MVKRTSLADLAAAELDVPPQAKADVAAQPKERRAHTSLYLHPKVRRAIREIALQYDRKPHDLYIEGIDMMLRTYGKPSVTDLSEPS